MQIFMPWLECACRLPTYRCIDGITRNHKVSCTSGPSYDYEWAEYVYSSTWHMVHIYLQLCICIILCIYEYN